MDHPCSEKENINYLMAVIRGNGEPGIKVDVAVIKQKLEDMPTPNQLKTYALVGSGLGSGIGVAIGIVGAFLWKVVF